MNEKQKRYAIVGGTVLIAVLLLLWFFRKSAASGQVIETQSPYDLPNVGAASFGPIYVEGNGPFSIPGLNLGGPDLSMIGACCSDCMQSDPFQAPTSSGGNTYVFNAGNQGSTIYNYSQPKTSSGSGGLCPFGTVPYSYEANGRIQYACRPLVMGSY